MILKDDVKVHYVTRNDHTGIKACTPCTAWRNAGWLILRPLYSTQTVSLRGDQTHLEGLETPTHPDRIGEAKKLMEGESGNAAFWRAV